MNVGDDYAVKHEAFSRAARAAFERADDGPQRTLAAWHFSLADAALLNRNEVDWLLAIHRAMGALEVIAPD
jgi:hypothetical protein